MKNKPIPSIIILSLFLGFFGCVSKNGSQTSSNVITPYQMVDQLNDSTFFSFVADIVADDSVILFLDHTNKRLIVCDHQFNLIKFIGHSGKGPGELQYPSEVSMKRWSALCLFGEDFSKLWQNLAGCVYLSNASVNYYTGIQ